MEEVENIRGFLALKRIPCKGRSFIKRTRRRRKAENCEEKLEEKKKRKREGRRSEKGG